MRNSRHINKNELCIYFNFFDLCRLLSFYNLRLKLRKGNFILETVNENNYNEETKMSRKTEISFYLEVSPRTTSSPS